jgi:hypothetical protein
MEPNLFLSAPFVTGAECLLDDAATHLFGAVAPGAEVINVRHVRGIRMKS